MSILGKGSMRDKGKVREIDFYEKVISCLAGSRYRSDGNIYRDNVPEIHIQENMKAKSTTSEQRQDEDGTLGRFPTLFQF